MVIKLRYIATCRNKVVNEHDAQLEDHHKFIMMLITTVEKELTPRSGRLSGELRFCTDDGNDFSCSGTYAGLGCIITLHLFSK